MDEVLGESKLISWKLWRLDSKGEERNVTYLSTLSRHSSTVNVVRWAPKGITLAQ
jgi:chromatin assembly factor 1 subunit B